MPDAGVLELVMVRLQGSDSPYSDDGQGLMAPVAPHLEVSGNLQVQRGLDTYIDCGSAPEVPPKGSLALFCHPQGF